jgi:hypothetical protein
MSYGQFRRGPDSTPIYIGRLPWDQEFESGFLQRRVYCEPDFREAFVTAVVLRLAIAAMVAGLLKLVLARDRAGDRQKEGGPAEGAPASGNAPRRECLVTFPCSLITFAAAGVDFSHP